MQRCFRIAGLALLGISFLSCDDVGKDLGGSGGTVALAAPTNLAGTPRAGGTEVLLAWSDNTVHETNYRVDVDWAPDFTSPIANVLLVPADTTSYVYSTFPATTYYFRVLAVTTNLESDPSNVFSITTPNPPPAPSGFKATTLSTSRLDLSWLDGARETGYRIERSADGGTSWAPIATLAVNTTSYSDLGLAADTEYGYRLYATNADGDSTPSAVWAMTASANITLTTLYSAGNVGWYTSIALGGGVKYITHFDLTNTNCLLTRGPLPPPSTPWVTWTIDSGPTGIQDVGVNGTSVATEAGGYVYIASQDATNSDLRFVTNYPGPQYVATSPDSAGSVGGRPRIAVSPADGTIHVVYVDNLAGPDQLKHAVRTNGLWSFETILPAPAYIASFSIAFEANGDLHVSLSRSPDGGTYELVHAEKSGGTWSFTSITNAGQPWDNSIAVDPSGYPHIAYCALPPSGATRRLMHATNSGGSWATEPVDEAEGRELGYFNSIAIHPTSGRIHIAYYDGGSVGDLRYARKDPGGIWVRRLLDALGNVGTHTSIALDANGIVNIAYRDESNADLKIAVGAP